ncbi:UNVERIFIED_CONTAM: hypothetical protein RMT77_019215 [Armadillidium vulgare]
MARKQVILLLAVIAISSARSRYGRYDSFESVDDARYNFDYAVRDDYSGNHFGHRESRDNGVTQGSYYVLLPDGRTQRVTYFVDGNSGYVANVSYDDEHPRQPSNTFPSQRIFTRYS